MAEHRPTIDFGMPVTTTDPGTTLLDSTKAWMLAHDWTEIGEGPAGWMWQHATGRKVGVPRAISDDRDLWDGLIYRLAQTHALSEADIEREIRGCEPERLTEDRLRQFRDDEYVCVTDDVRSMFTELLALRAYAADHEGRCDTLCPRCGIDIGLKRCDACGRPRFSDRHLAQVTRDRDRANVVLAHIVESLDADEDLAWEHLPDMVRDLRTQQDRVTDLFETWAAEENEHRLANEFGIAEGLKVAIDGLREAVHGTERKAGK